MPSTLADFSRLLPDLSDPNDLGAPVGRLRVNAHVHLPPNFSAFETTTQALELAQAQNVGVLGASNYYDYSIYVDFAAQASKRGIFPIFGLEIISLVDDLVKADIKINDPGNPGKMYLCGKGITRFAPLNDRAARLLQTIRDNDSARMKVITEKLAQIFAQAGVETGLNAEAVKDRVVRRHGCLRQTVYLQERHIAQAFQETLFEEVPEGDRTAFLARIFGVPSKGDAVSVQNEIRSHLMKAGKPAFVPDTFVDFDHAYQLILALGGIPCYPTLADGANPIGGYEADVDELIADLKRRGVYAAEFIPVRNAPDALSRYVHAMRDAGLIITAGTEHNTLDLLPIEPTCLGGEPIPDDINDIFWEGTCVVAAHQTLGLQGQAGFVDAEGRPNAEYASGNERIDAFRKIGAALIAHYQAACARRMDKKG